jgi:hypothetical protein
LLGVEIVDSLSVGEFVVGVGTILLAAFTAWLGFSTRSSARAAQEAVERAEEPYVIAAAIPGAGRGVPQPRGGSVDEIHETQGTLRLRLWNVGSGPTIVREVRLRSHERRDGKDVILADGLPAHLPIAARDAEDVRDLPSPRWRDQRTGVLRIDYDHSNGHRYATESQVKIEEERVRCLTYSRRRVSAPL